ncbi:hypothetical protein BG000_010147 [Podila horticola]|nr:hypothetical protein BG000_010147 [Podila horticola]
MDDGATIEPRLRDSDGGVRDEDDLGEDLLRRLAGAAKNANELLGVTEDVAGADTDTDDTGGVLPSGIAVEPCWSRGQKSASNSGTGHRALIPDSTLSATMDGGPGYSEICFLDWVLTIPGLLYLGAVQMGFGSAEAVWMPSLE